MSKKKAAVIVAAGRSSRMGLFKPLLSIGSSTIIETAINTFRSLNIKDIIVITGKNANELEAHIKYTGATCIRSNYTQNKMFDSACIGLEYVKDKCDMVFFTPADSPLFTKYSLKKMILQMELYNNSVICPCYLKEKGHPLLINSNSIDDILSYEGTCGIRGAIMTLKNVGFMNLPDPALIMDADTPEDYEAMIQYEKNRAVPTKEVCAELHEYFLTPKKIQKHCEKVAITAVEISKSLIEKGYYLDIEKVQSGALVHDIFRDKKNHAAEGAKLLEDLGFIGIAPVVKAHTELDEYDSHHINEKSVVYLADKLVYRDSMISLEERFKRKMELYKNDEYTYKIIKKRYKQAQKVQKMIKQAIKGEGSRG